MERYFREIDTQKIDRETDGDKDSKIVGKIVRQTEI